ncbi:Hypothetical protein, putative [Bodo saltans]|uniref:Uncharacterized protein n=1 Tax=Bodo saltans TaxID=75058 RepID=A0A0S4JBU0_BODSA|nr:Hypothetical protein, putative [Bodo saltans]|eukprot:CUG87683.1 Hypothetical protein, putative [Bodo saltans]
MSLRVSLLLSAETAKTLRSLQQGPKLDILPIPSQLALMVRNALQVMCAQLPQKASDDTAAVDWITAALGNATDNVEETRVALFVHPSCMPLLQRVASLQEVSIDCPADDLKPEVLLPLPFSCVADIRDALVQCATTIKPLDVDSASWIARAICSITAVQDLPVLELMAVDRMRESVLALAASASTPITVFDVCSAICNNTGVGDPGERLFAFLTVRDAMLAMSHHATTSSAAQWFADAVASIHSGERSSAPIFATQDIADTLAAVAQYATTDEAARRVAMSIHHLYGDARGTFRFESFKIRDALVLLSQHVSSAEGALCVASALYTIVSKCDIEWLKAAFLSRESHDALVRLATLAAEHAECAGWAAMAILTLARRVATDAEATSTSISIPLATVEMRDALLLLSHIAAPQSLGLIAKALLCLAMHNSHATFAVPEVKHALLNMKAAACGTDAAETIASAYKFLFSPLTATTTRGKRGREETNGDGWSGIRRVL